MRYLTSSTITLAHDGDGRCSFKKLLACCIVFVSLSGCVSLITPKVQQQLIKLKPGQYALDKTHASVLFKVQHLGLSTYVGRFNQFDASLEFDPQRIKEANLDATIDIESLDINNPDLKADLMGGTWFAQKKYPQAAFSTTSVTPLTDNSFDFTGDLTWRGVTKPIRLTVVFHGGATNILTQKYTLGFSATGSFKRSDFGMDAYIPLVGDEIHLEVYAEFQRR